MLYIANKAADCLAILNYDVNFFLYCLCGSVFRRQLMTQCCGSGQVTGKRCSVITMTTYQSARSRSSVHSSYQNLLVKRRSTTDVNAQVGLLADNNMRYSAASGDLNVSGDVSRGQGQNSRSPSPQFRRSISPSSRLPLIPRAASDSRKLGFSQQQQQQLLLPPTSRVVAASPKRSRFGLTVERPNRALSDSVLR